VRAVDTMQRTEQDRFLEPVRRAVSDTPRRLLLAGALVAVLVITLTVTLLAALSSARGALSAMSAKSDEVSATNDLYFRLNDMDAQAANALLVGFHPTMAVPASSSAASSLATYDTDRSAASGDLQLIAVNTNLAARYRTLLTALGGYEGMIAQAFYVDQNASSQAPAAPPAAALALYEQASGQMHSSVLPIARDISTGDSADVDAMYAGDRGGARRGAVLVALLGLLVAGALIAVNRHLGRRFRRVLTPALALAALLTLAVAGSGTSVLAHEATQFKVAKSDAFDSINALTEARALSYDANADESRWLLDRSSALQSSFFTKASQIADTPGVDAAAAAADPALYYSALRQAAGALTVDPGRDTVANVRLRGLLGTELNNITFPREAQGAFSTAQNFDTYVQDDAVIRADAARGDLAAAVAFDVGTGPGQSNTAFYRYDQALLGIIAINQGAFHTAIDDGRGALGPWAWLPYANGLLVLVLLAAGLYPRLREYR
jgi:hypothetical protein